MSVRDELLAAEDASWHELGKRLARLAEPDWIRPGVNGEWSAKDILAHIAVWHANTTDRLESLRMTGELPTFPDVDTFNDDQFRANRDLSLHDVRVMSGAARHRFREEVALLERDPAEALARMVFGNAHGHYEEHIPQLDAFLGVAP